MAKRRDFPELIDLDSKCFGTNRKKLLEPIFHNNSNLCCFSTEGGETIGYVAAKVYDKMAEVGPLVCHANRVKDAVLLLKAILNRLSGREVFLYIPKKETELLNLLYQAGLKKDFSVMRMVSGPAIARNCIYTAESLERG